MTTRLRLRLALVGILVIILAANAGATLYAAATASTITACVSAKGVMAYAPSGKCPKGQMPLTWNVTGPQGPIGPAGPAGAALPPALWAADWSPDPFFTGASAATNLSVPAGTYLVSLQLDLTASAASVPPTAGGTTLTTARCTLSAGSASQTFANSLYLDWSATISKQVVATVSGGGKISVSCSQTTTGPSATVPFVRLAIDGLLTAMPVAAQ